MPFFGDAANEPIIDSVDPGQGSAAGGTLLTITGNLLADVTKVVFDGTEEVSTTERSETSVKCMTPAHAPGSVDLIVSNESAKSNALPFRFE